MDVTIVGLQNAGKTSIVRVLAVSHLTNSKTLAVYHPGSAILASNPPQLIISLHFQGQEFAVDSIPTVAFNKKEVKKGHVLIRCWDLGGQVKFRNMWERYCRDVTAVIFVVDSSDRDAIAVANDELHALLAHETLNGVPLLVLANKSDLREKMSVDEVIEGLDLKKIVHREISCYGVSAKEETNLEAVLQWLVARSGK